MLGRYRVHKRIARGGMADVWYGTAYGLGGFRKRVVIKTIRQHLARDREYIDLLVNEAALAARLTHPNIVPVFDFGCAEGVYYLVMEYLPGRTLAQVLRRVRAQDSQVPTWLVLSVLASCCDGLQYAHDRTDSRGNPLGLLHRDLSPGNLMLSFTGNLSILDFGVAGTAADGAGKPRTKVTPGKYHYMAPERVRGESADCRSDLYSLGVVMYQLLTQRLPFRGHTVEELVHRILHEPPLPPRSVVADLPEDVVSIVRTAMSPRPEDRYPNAASMGTALRRSLRRQGIISDIGEVGERIRYLNALFPEAREVFAHAGTPALGIPALSARVGLTRGEGRALSRDDEALDADADADAQADPETPALATAHAS